MQQLFIFLSAIIVIIASVYLGLRLFGTVERTACESMDLALFQDVKHALSVNAEYGSTNQVTIRPSCESELLCFVDNEMIGKPITEIASPTGTELPYVALKRLVSTGAKYTIYQYSDETFLPVGYDDRVRVAVPASTPPIKVLCIENVNGFTFSTKGGGLTITVSPKS
jgi:hypothetical protein